MEAPSPNKRPPQWRRRFYVHKIQRTYAIWLGLFMFFSALLVFGLVFFIPFILPAIKLASPLPLAERARSEEHTSELQSPCNLVCRLLLEKKKLTSDLILRTHVNFTPTYDNRYELGVLYHHTILISLSPCVAQTSSDELMRTRTLGFAHTA